MDLSDFYPAPAELIKSELSILEYLRSNPYIKEKHPQVARDAADYLPRNQRDSGFEFNTHFDVWNVSMRKKGDGNEKRAPNVRLILSARLEFKKKAFTNVTYCLSICRVRSTSRTTQLTILRKFHFDVTASAGNRTLAHPQTHLQYCGEMLPYMNTLGCREAQLNQMHPWLSEPRILFWPMSLALLIDMALHQFPDQASAKFRADSYWRGLVRSQETLLLQPFCAKCVEIISDVGEKNRTLTEAFDIF